MASPSVHTPVNDVLEAASVTLRLASLLVQSELDSDTFTDLAQVDLYESAPYGTSSHTVQEGLDRLRCWARSFSSDPETVIKEMQSDNMRLFHGPQRPAAAPWESVYLSRDRLLFQESTLDVRNRYRTFGLESKKLSREPDDSISLELEFCAELMARAARSASEGHAEETARYMTALADFFSSHLGRWYTAWCDAVEANARTSFYRGAALLARGLLDTLADDLSLFAIANGED